MCQNLQNSMDSIAETSCRLIALLFARFR